jgi:hypothetical protein
VSVRTLDALGSAVDRRDGSFIFLVDVAKSVKRVVWESGCS